MECRKCKSQMIVRNGKSKLRIQRYYCKNCYHSFQKEYHYGSFYEMEIEGLLKDGYFYGFELNKSLIEDVISILGPYDESEKSQHFIECYWNNVSMIFDADKKILMKIKLEFDEETSYKTIESNQVSFEKKIGLDLILFFLNHKQIPYQISNPELDFDYVFISLENNVRIAYYLPWKELIDISIVNENW